MRTPPSERVDILAWLASEALPMAKRLGVEGTTVVLRLPSDPTVEEIEGIESELDGIACIGFTK